MRIDELMSGPATPAAGKALVDWAVGLRGRILRGDMMIGILSVAEVEKAPSALERAARCGVPTAWLELARWHAQPPFGAPNLPEAERALKAARDAHVPRAGLEVVRLRWFHRRDDATPEERREACALAREAVAQDPSDSVATYLLGLITCQGFGTAADPAAAAELQCRAASLGNADAMFELYVHHQTGLGMPRDERAAFDHVRQAAEAGHPRAMYNMGAFHATGQNVPKDLGKAVEWYTRASDAGNLRATAILAMMYATGEGVAKDLERARELFDVADDMGFDTADLREAAGL